VTMSHLWTRSVAQHVFALLLELTTGLGTRADGASRPLEPNDDWCYWDQPLIELAGLTLGVVATAASVER